MEIMDHYRYLHKIPELGRELPKTTAYIIRCLKGLGCRITTPTEGSVCAFFDYGREETLCFRADTDALPVSEETGLLYASQHPGKMHACGHDGHTAILLGLGERLKKGAFNVLLIFQPGEETDGGAEALCKAGILRKYRVKYIFALHLWPGLPKGEIFSRAGVLMCGSMGIRASFTGESVHIANYRAGADALTACCQFTVRAQELLPPGKGLLKFGKLEGGTAENILCGKAVLLGSLRLLSDIKIPQQLEELCQKVARKYGCQGEILFRPGYPAVRNEEKLLSRLKSIHPIQDLPAPLYTTEDFSFYQQEVPGVYVLLGLGDAPPLHSPRFSFDPGVLSRGVAYFQQILEKLGAYKAECFLRG